MKKEIFTTIAISMVFGVMAQNACCKKSEATETFAMLTHNDKFIAAHLEPTPFKLASPIGKDIQIKTSDKQDAHVYEIKAAKPTNNYVLVIHEWWGLNDYIKQESEKIFNVLGNVNVIAIDMYDNNVATVRDSAAKYMNAVKTERAEAIINGVYNYIGKTANVATIGWCFGGGWSLQTALLGAKQTKACIMYYGMPEEKTEKLKTLNAPVLFVWPEQDQWINKEVVSKFENNMKLVQKKLEVKKYDADHAFANPSNPRFNKEFAENAFNHSINFIKELLK